MRTNMRVLEISILLGLVALAGACHKRTPAATPPAAVPSTAAAPAPPGPPTCTLTAEPATVTAGKAVTVSWTSTNASTVDLKPGLGQQQAEGSTAVTPSESTTYTLSLSGPGGTGECSARVTVTPAVPQAPSVQESNVTGAGAAPASAMEDAFFDFNKADIRPDAQTALAHDADYLKGHPAAKLRIGGYCDPRGSEEYNLGLGQRRADAAEQFLVHLGITPDRISTISYGKDKPFCTDQTEECYQKNRRANLVLLSGNGG